MNEQERKSKAKKVFWWTCCITVFLVIIFSSFLGEWLHIKSLSSAFVVPQMIAGVYAGNFVCRKRGLSLEKHTVAPLAYISKTNDLYNEKTEFEVRSILPNKPVTWLSIVVSALLTSAMAICLAMSPPRHLSDIFSALLMLLVLVSCACLTAYLFKTRDTGRLIISIEDQQLSTTVLGFKTSVPWGKVNSCQVIDSKGVWGQDTSRIQFLDVEGKVLTTVWLMSMKLEDKAAFLNYLNERFAPEPNRVLD
jgi:hypothetical protein